MSLLKKVMVKPWEHTGEPEGAHGDMVIHQAPAKTGLFVFLSVLSSFFMLIMISYYTRSLFPDWEMLSDPRILWVNTVVLVFASVAMQMASSASKTGDYSRVKRPMVVGGMLTLVFIVGQLMAWDQLVEQGFYLQANPSFAFYYLLTGLHALHLTGGLWFLARVWLGMGKEEGQERACRVAGTMATYWHYLLLLWLVMFVLLLKT